MGIGTMFAEAATAVGDGMDSLEGLFGMGSANVNGTVNPIPSRSDMMQGAGAAISSAPVGRSAGDSTAAGTSSFLSDWATKAIGPVMQSIAGAAMRPHRQTSAPLGGGAHGVNVNTGSYDQVIKGIGNAAGGDPLHGLSGFKNLL